MKSKIILISVLSAVLLGFVALFIFLPSGKGETDREKFSRIVENTGEAIYEQNKMLVGSYNSTLGGGGSLSAQQNPIIAENISSTFSLFAQTTADMYINDYEMSMALLHINELYMWYTISEYFNDYLDGDFLDKTFLVNGVSEADMYAKIKLTEKGVDIYIYFIWYEDSSHSVVEEYSYQKVSIEYDLKKNEPILIEMYEYGDGTQFEYRVLDFIDNKFSYTFLQFIEEAEYEDIIKKDNDYFKKNIDEVRYCTVKFNDITLYSGKTIGNIKESDFGTNLNAAQTADILDLYQNMKFGKLSEFVKEVNTKTKDVYEDGARAENYIESKYTIKPNDEGKLCISQNKGMNSDLEETLLFFEDCYTGDKEFEYNEEFDNIDYVYNHDSSKHDSKFEEYDGTNFKKEINIATVKSVVPENVFNVVENWYVNLYDEEKFYFEYEKVGDYYLSCINNIYHSTLYLIKVEQSKIEVYSFDYYRVSGNDDFWITKYVIDENKFCYTELLINFDNGVISDADYKYYELSIGYDDFINDFYLEMKEYIDDSDVPTYLIDHEEINYYNDDSYAYSNKEIVYGRKYFEGSGYGYAVIDKTFYFNDHMYIGIMDEMLALEGLGVEF